MGPGLEDNQSTQEDGGKAKEMWHMWGMLLEIISWGEHN